MTVSSALDAEGAARTAWDAIVIGAGPAGALAARQLAQSGLRTLLVERRTFPRPKVCGACVNSRALTVMRDVGLNALPARVGGVQINGVRIHAMGRQARLPVPEGMAISRERLDSELVQEATKSGAALLTQTTAALVPADGVHAPLRRVELARDGERSVAAARVVLLAGGLGAVRQSGEFRSETCRRSRLGIGATVAEFSRDYGPGTIFMAVGHGGYVGLVRIEEDRLNVAAAVDPSFLRRRGSPADAVGAILRQAGLPPIPVLAEAEWLGTIPMTRRTRPLAGRRVFLLGDAAGYVEPFTGEGIAWALESAVAVTPLAAEAASRWRPELVREWTRIHRTRIARRQRWCRLLTAGLRHPRAVSVALAALSVAPQLAAPVVRRVCGSSLSLRIGYP